jgi:hypothetical protein
METTLGTRGLLNEQKERWQMATVPTESKVGSNERPDDEQLERDRRTGVLIFLALLVLAGLLIWLASLAGTSSNGEYLEYMGR